MSETLTIDDNLTFSRHALERMVSLSIDDVNGIAWMHRSRHGKIIDAVSGKTNTRSVTVTETRFSETVDVYVDISMEYNANALDIFSDIHKQVHRIFRMMTPLKVRSVNVRISDISMPEDVEASVDEFVV